MNPRKTVMVYIDGFSLYKGMLQRGFPEYKWLDLEALAARLFPRRRVTGVKFFTAPLKPLTNDPGVGQRQQVYWRALQTTCVEIIEGKFNFSKQYLPLHPEELDESGRVRTVLVKRPEEKGSDVALASHLIVDALENRADSYALITNDSDLVPPLQLLSARGRDLTLVSVVNEKYNKAFDAAGLQTIRQIRRGALASSQFPKVLQDSEGRTFRKPPTWP
ncbi:NYN domain-containing protein [Rhodoglobus sp. NPDC076762]